MIDTDGSQFSVSSIGPEAGYGNQHYDTVGQTNLGAAFARAWIDALPKPQLKMPVKSDGGWNVGFTGVSGFTYAVDRTTNLPGAWSTVTNIFMGTAGATNFTDPNAFATGAFYRVKTN